MIIAQRCDGYRTEALLRSRLVQDIQSRVEDEWQPTAQLMHSDARLRWDWTQFEAHTRQRLASSMRYEHTVLGQQSVMQADTAQRNVILEEERQHRSVSLCNEGGRIAMLLHEEGRRAALEQSFADTFQQLWTHHNGTLAAAAVASDLELATGRYLSAHDQLLDEGWAECLRTFHSAVTSWHMVAK